MKRLLFALLLLLPAASLPAQDAALDRNALYLRDAFAARGVQMELLKLPGAPPLVYGAWTTPGATRTLGLYVHYDGQPVDEGRWTQAPWTWRGLFFTSSVRGLMQTQTPALRCIP